MNPPLQVFIGQIGLSSVAAILMSWRTDTTYGTTYTALASGTVLTILNVGGIAGPQLFTAADAPLYSKPFAILSGFAGLAMLAFAGVYLVERYWPRYCGPNGPLHGRKRFLEALETTQMDIPEMA